MAKVFVSYSRKDIVFAKRLTAELQKCELDFWIDWEGIPPTVDWWKEIEKGIEEADVFLFLISPDSAKSKVCGQEIEVAVKNGKRIIPIVVRDIAWEDTPKHLGHLNYIFIRENDDFDAAVNKLITAIQTDYEWAATHRRLQVKALEWERENKENSFLLRGRDLQDAEFDLATNTSKDPHPTDLQREYVLESRKATDRQRRLLTSISIAGVITLAALALFGFYQANIATKKAILAQSQVLAMTSNVNRDQILESVDRRNTATPDELTKNLLLSAESLHLVKDNLRAERIFAEQALRDSLNLLDRVYLSDAISDSPENRQGKTNFISFHQSYYLKPNLNAEHIKISPDGKWLAVSSYSGRDILLYDIPEVLDTNSKDITEKPILQNKEPRIIVSPVDSVYSLSFSPDGTWLAASGCDGQDDVNTGIFACAEGILAIWKMDTLTMDPILLKKSEYVFNQLVFSQDSTLLAAGGCQKGGDTCTQGSLLIWDMIDPSAYSIQTTKIISEVYDLVLSPDGQWIATIGCKKDDDTSDCSRFATMLWDLGNVTTKSTLIDQMDNSITLTFTPDGRRLIIGGCNMLADGSSFRSAVAFYDMEEQATSLTFPQNPAGNCVWKVAISSNGDQLVTSYVNMDSIGGGFYGVTEVQLWQVKDLSASSLNFHNVFSDRTNERLTKPFFSPNGEWLVISDFDLVRIYKLDHEDLLNAACHVVGRNFTRSEWNQYLPNERYQKTCDQLPEEPETSANALSTP